MTPGIGQKSTRTEALDLHKQGWRPERIAAALDVDLEQVNTWIYGKPQARISRTQTRRRQGISPASPAQRAKVKDRSSILGGEGPCDPAHIWPRSLGGCDDALCVFPAIREEHRAYDLGKLDILPALLAHGFVPELQHALGHAQGDLIALLERVTSEKWRPVA